MKNKIATVILFVFLAIVTILPRLYKINAPLADWHSWRQADTVSVTRYLIEDNFDVLHPRYHDISRIQTGYENPKGLRFVEFPVFNLIHATIFLSTGINFEVAGRIVSIIAAVIISWTLFLIGKKMASFWSGFFSSIIFSILPFAVYFTRVTLPDPLSTAMGLLGAYLFWEYTDPPAGEAGNKKIFLFSSAISFSLGLLVKPFAIFFAVPVAILAIRKWGWKVIINIPLLIALDIALIPFLLWRGWMQQFDLLVGIPFSEWLLNGDHIRFRPSWWFWVFGERIGKLISGYWGLVLVGAGFLSAKSKNFLIYLGIALFVYVSIFATANVKHDYYQTLITPVIALAMGHGIYSIYSKRYLNKIYASFFVLLTVGLTVLLSFYWVRENYKINDYNMLAAAERIKEISEPDDLIIAPYNGNSVFLYHTGRRGWPVVTTNIDQMIDWGAKYFVSTTRDDTDSKNFKNRFELIEETDQYLILKLVDKSL